MFVLIRYIAPSGLATFTGLMSQGFTLGFHIPPFQGGVRARRKKGRKKGQGRKKGRKKGQEPFSSAPFSICFFSDPFRCSISLVVEHHRLHFNAVDSVEAVAEFLYALVRANHLQQKQAVG